MLISHTQSILDGPISSMMREDDGGDIIGGAAAHPSDQYSAPDPEDVQADFDSIGKPEGGGEPDENTDNEPSGDEPSGDEPAGDEPAGDEPKKVEEPEKKPEPDKKVEEKKPDEEKKPEPDSDEELEKIQVKKNAPINIQNDFKRLKEITRQQREEKKALREELEQIKATGTKLPEDVEARLKQAEDDRKYRLIHEAENDPQFAAEFDQKIEKAEVEIVELLKSKKLKQEVLDEMKEKGYQNWPRWDELLSKFKNPLDKQELIDALAKHRGVVKEKDAKLAEITADRDGYYAKKQEAEKGYRQTLQRETEKLAVETYPWALYKEVKEGMSKEDKAAAEAHNAEVDGLGKQAVELVAKVESKDPRAISDLVMAKFDRDRIAKQLAERDEIIKSKDAEIAAIEEKLGAIKNAGKIAHRGNASPTKASGRIIESDEEQADFSTL